MSSKAASACRLAHGLTRRLIQPASRRVRRLRRRAGILMYHRICEETCDPWAICVPQRAFDEQLATLARGRSVVDLGALAGADAYTRDGARLALTFDDGYVDNLTAALPVLERYELPATLFVVGHAVGRTREFWWDALQRALLESGPLPAAVEFPFGAGPHAFMLAHQPNDRPDGHGFGEDWRADSGLPGTPRQQLFRTLWNGIVVLDPAEQDAAVDHLLAWAGQPLTPPSGRLPVTADQLEELARHPLISIGSHTLDHLSLPDLPAEQQHAQVRTGHRLVRELIGRPVDRFSYPFGRVDHPARAAVRELGVAIACTSVPTPATIGDDRLALPRLQATAMDGDQFARWLRDDHALLTGSRQSS